MTDSNPPPLGVGIDFRVTGIAGALSDCDGAVVLSGSSGDFRFPPELYATPTGVEPLLPNSSMESIRTSPVLPRYDREEELPPAEYEVQFELELESLISGLAAEWRKNVPAALKSIGWESSKQKLPECAVISVPGAYDSDDRTAVERSFEAAGIDVGAVVGAPVSIAAAELPSISEPQQVVVVDIGAHWFDAAIVNIDPDQRSCGIVSQVSKPGIGRNAMDEALAEWVIERAAQDDNSRVTYGESSIQDLKTVASEALKNLTNDGTASIVVEKIPGVTTEDGLTLGVDTTIDTADAHEALEEVEKTTIDGFRDLFETTDVGRGDIDKILVAGPGINPVPIANAVSGFFDQPLADPYLGGRDAAAPMGAAVLAAHMAKWDKNPIQRDTLDHDIGLLIPTGDGTTFETVVPGSASVGSTEEVTLKTTQDDQTRGQITVATRHLGSGEIASEQSHEVTGIPARQAGEARISLSVTGGTTEEGGINISPSMKSDSETTLSLDPPTETAPMLTLSGQDLLEYKIPEPDETSLATRAETTFDSLENLSPESVLSRIMSVRYKLWHTSEANATFDPSDVENLLREFNSALRRLDVEPIEPDPGDEKDLTKHTVWQTRPAEAPDGTILEIRKPGYKIGDNIENEADVITSKGDPESADEPSEEQKAADSNSEDSTEEVSDIDTDDGGQPNPDSDLKDPDRNNGSSQDASESKSSDQSTSED